ncbi:MAG: hypothetical protein Kow0056_08160 [Coriobacteriia bacterium]
MPKLDKVMGSSLAVGLATGAGRVVPPRAARRIGAAMARVAARRDSTLARAVRMNQWMASGRTLAGEALDAAVEETLRHAVMAQYHLYHNFGDARAMTAMVEIDDSMAEVLERSHGSPEGTIVVGPHVGNFDFGMHALGHAGFRAQFIGVPDPGGGYRKQYEQRASAGVEVLPMSKKTYARSLETLREGGCVGIGVDRPSPGSKYRPVFFGHPASLPVVHVRLALVTGAPIWVASAILEESGKYRITARGPIVLGGAGDRRRDTLAGAERVLRVAEDVIRSAPKQWLMFYPVWPDLEDEVPK